MFGLGQTKWVLSCSFFFSLFLLFSVVCRKMSLFGKRARRREVGLCKPWLCTRSPLLSHHLNRRPVDSLAPRSNASVCLCLSLSLSNQFGETWIAARSHDIEYNQIKWIVCALISDTKFAFLSFFLSLPCLFLGGGIHTMCCSTTHTHTHTKHDDS